MPDLGAGRRRLAHRGICSWVLARLVCLFANANSCLTLLNVKRPSSAFPQPASTVLQHLQSGMRLQCNNSGAAGVNASAVQQSLHASAPAATAALAASPAAKRGHQPARSAAPSLFRHSPWKYVVTGSRCLGPARCCVEHCGTEETCSSHLLCLGVCRAASNVFSITLC